MKIYNIMKAKYIKNIKWIFLEPTRIVELLSACIAFFFALSMLFNYNVLTNVATFSFFAVIGNQWIYFIIMLMALAQLYASFFSTTIYKYRRAQILLWVGTVFAILASSFGLSYPPLSTGFFTYIVIAFANLAAYSYLEITTEDIEFDKLNRLKNKNARD